NRGLTGELRPLRPGTSLEELLRDASSFAAVVAAGGDGTVSAVAHSLAETQIPVLAYPAGTANLIALNLGLPSDPAELAEVLLAGRTQPTDLAELRYTDASGGSASTGFTVAAGTGFDAKMIADSEALKPRFGVGGYVLSALANANPTVARFRLELDGRPYLTEGIGVLVANFAKLQLGLELAPGANAQDGLLEVVILKTRSAAGLVPVLLRQLAEKVGLAASQVSDRLEIHSVKRVRLESDPPLPVQFDGESVDGSPPLEAWVVPERVRFIVPAAPDA
ncbi:MAG: NAD(+)/NADH kinase, partial [Meiothermus silvanus]|nr:NAD(+)/NADH kinase [Allomeiothermus silvanus]